MLCFASALSAGSLAPGCPTPDAPLTTYLTRVTPPNSDLSIPFECSVGILNFTNFSFNATGDLTNPLTSDEIKVTPEANGNLGGGFAFSAEDPVNRPFVVGPGQTETYMIDWLVVIDPGPFMSSADLGMDPPFGTVTITQKYCGDGNTDGPNFCSTGFQPLTVSSPPCTDPLLHPENCTTTLNFNPTIQQFAEVITTITLTGGTDLGAGFDSLTGTSSVVDPNAPEPGTVFLGAGVLLSLVYARKRAN